MPCCTSTHTLSVPAIAGRCWLTATRIAVEIQRAAERLAERDQPLELFRAMLGASLVGDHRRLRPSPAAGDCRRYWWKKNARRQQDQRGHQRQPALPLDLARVSPADAKSDDEKTMTSAVVSARDQEKVLTAKNLHWRSAAVSYRRLV